MAIRLRRTPHRRPIPASEHCSLVSARPASVQHQFCTSGQFASLQKGRTLNQDRSRHVLGRKRSSIMTASLGPEHEAVRRFVAPPCPRNIATARGCAFAAYPILRPPRNLLKSTLRKVYQTKALEFSLQPPRTKKPEAGWAAKRVTARPLFVLVLVMVFASLASGCAGTTGGATSNSGGTNPGGATLPAVPTGLTATAGNSELHRRKSDKWDYLLLRRFRCQFRRRKCQLLRSERQAHNPKPGASRSIRAHGHRRQHAGQPHMVR
jgi:hypothetical protein